MARLTPAWRGALLALCAFALLVEVAFFVVQVARDFSAGKLLGFAVMCGVLLVLGASTLALTRLAARAPARLLLFAPLVVATSSWVIGPRAAVLTVVVGTLVALAGAALATRRRAVAAGVALAFLALGATLLGPREPANGFLAAHVFADRTLPLPDPGARGPLGAKLVTYAGPTVDGTRLVRGWEGLSGALRTRHWGLDASRLPLRGRAWLPEGPGPFPVFVMIHGDHAMEEPGSAAGYDYLGEVLASRGFLFVAVDETFLNTSLADMASFLSGRPAGLHGNNDVRAWLALEHLALLRRLSADPSSVFFGMADLSRVAVGGHSVGGEAASLMAAFNTLDAYPDDGNVHFAYRFGIRGVLSVASGRGEYLPRGTLTELQNVDYLALHGALDAQSTSFGGQSQYSRVRPANFKAAVLVAGANHDQFNTAWGRIDVPDFWGWALDTRELLPAEAQRQLAKVYFGAFAETVLHQRREYQPMFGDARLAAAWLPRTYVTSRYTDAREERLADFEDDADVTTAPGARVRGEHLERWGETWVPLQKGAFDTHALSLRWARPDARLIFEFDAPHTGTALVMSLAAGEDVREPLDFELVVTDADGVSVRRALSEDQLLYPALEARTRLPFLEAPGVREATFRRYSFPLTSSVKRFELVFNRTARGSLSLDDLGVTP